MDWTRIIINTLEAAVGLPTLIFALAAIGLNLHFGYTGLLNFGQAAFLAVGAYGLATAVSYAGLPFFVAVIVGLLSAVVLALLLGVPTLRLRADYLAIVTIAAAEIVRLLFRSVTLREYFGGSDGLQDFAGDFYAINPIKTRLEIGQFGFSARLSWVLLVGWILVAVASLVVFLLVRSPWGRVIKAIREDEDAVRSLGKNVYSYKIQSLIIGGVLGSLGGFVYALGQAAVQPDFFGTETTFFAYTVLILGGAARVAAPIVGAMIFNLVTVFLDNVLNDAVDNGFKVPFILDSNIDVGPIKVMLVGLTLMLLMIYRPQGIFGDRRELAIDAR